MRVYVSVSVSASSSKLTTYTQTFHCRAGLMLKCHFRHIVAILFNLRFQKYTNGVLIRFGQS